MKIEQIRQVLSIHQAGSINKAAQSLFVSQPCVSNSLKALENELQQKIFIRSHAGMTLTEFGRQFVENAQYILKYSERIEAAAKELSSAKAPLTFSVSVSHLLFAHVTFRKMMEKYQNASVDFRYNQASVSNTIQDVHNRSTELGLISIPDIDKTKWMAKLELEDLCYERVFVGKPAAMVARTNSLAQKGVELTVQDLQDYPLIIIGERLPMFDSINKKIRSVLGAKSVVEVNDRATAHEFIQSKNAYCCVVKCDKIYQNIPFFSYADSFYISDTPFLFEIGWVYRNDVYHSKLAVEFMQEIEALFS